MTRAGADEPPEVCDPEGFPYSKDLLDIIDEEENTPWFHPPQ